LEGVKLQGVFGSGDTAGIIALVKDKKQRILLGEQLRGWTLDSVSPDRVVLISDGRRQELFLRTAKVVAVEPAAQEPGPGPVRKEAAGKVRENVDSAAGKPRVTPPADPRGVTRR
jgi:hypothetical protein